MAWVHATVERRATIAAAREDLWRHVSDVERLAVLIPKVERAEPVGSDWRWTIVEHGALGYRVQPVFTVRIEERAPVRIAFRHVGDPDAPDGRAHGALELAEVGPATTDARVAIEVHLDLAIPRLLTDPARRVIEREAGRAAAGFLDNVAAAVGA